MQSFTSSRIEPPHLNVLAYKIYPYKNIYFCHHQKRFTCDPPLRFISRSVQLAHSTKELWENENSKEYRKSFLPKKIFGVNRTPKFSVNVANSYLKRLIAIKLRFCQDMRRF